jgi:hypothetical protein
MVQAQGANVISIGNHVNQLQGETSCHFLLSGGGYPCKFVCNFDPRGQSCKYFYEPNFRRGAVIWPQLVEHLSQTQGDQEIEENLPNFMKK